MIKSKKRIRKIVEHGRVYINASWNNTIATLTDAKGEVLTWNSPGKNGFKGSRQSTPYAGQIAAEKLVEAAESFGMKSVDVYVKGMGPARDQTIRGLMNGGMRVCSIACVSRLPHGGCRPKKIRRG